MRTPEQIIKRPLLTEKGTRLKDTGGRSDGEELDPETMKSQLLFEVASDANKVEIRAAVQKLWNVDVVSVRTTVVRGKEKRMGRFVGKRSNWKKAIVTIAAGQTVEFFEGV
ncbi:MAG TPA: 50S ribosomal protein L23 [Polyangia bacterium]|jgi:large subunit ribosomal protein L23|nr:50S ribosomal protein L23 [Polyangia bacterium]